MIEKREKPNTWYSQRVALALLIGFMGFMLTWTWIRLGFKWDVVAPADGPSEFRTRWYNRELARDPLPDDSPAGVERAHGWWGNVAGASATGCGLAVGLAGVFAILGLFQAYRTLSQPPDT